MSNRELVGRFLRYVQIDTQSCEDSNTAPSTYKQFDLLRLLERELHDFGLIDVYLSEHGVLMGTLPASEGLDSAPKIGFLAHVDTSPDASGALVHPLVHENYDGKDIRLPVDGEIIKVKDSPNLKKVKGHTVITSDGSTLLGADDKAGVAIIMEFLSRLKDIPHGTIKVGFTPDEEIGRGVDHFDVKVFGADFAYTIDGAELGEIEDATFNAASAVITVKGSNIHPGYAKNKMVNAVRVLAHLVSKLPLAQSPEKTEKMEGFFHPHQMQGDVSQASVKILLRDFELTGIKVKSKFLKELCRQVGKRFPGVKIDLEIKEQYKNMKYLLKKRPEVVKYAMKAMEEVGITPILKSIRGGTDGSRLSFMGLLTPNLFAGGQNFHSKREWVSVEWMEKSVETLVALAKIWGSKRR